MTRGRAVVAKPHARRNTREGCSTAEGVPGRESCASSRTGGRSGLGSVHEGPLPTRSGAPALPCGSRNLEWVERQGHPEVDSRLEGRRECLLRCAAVHSGGFRCRETPGSPGTARVVKATRGRSREIDETRVLVAVLGSRDWQAASPYVIQGKSQGDLGMRGLARYQPSGAVDAASWGSQGRANGCAELDAESVTGPARGSRSGTKVSGWLARFQMSPDSRPFSPSPGWSEGVLALQVGARWPQGRRAPSSRSDEADRWCLRGTKGDVRERSASGKARPVGRRGGSAHAVTPRDRVMPVAKGSAAEHR